MNINEFIAQYRNHPVLFVGAGVSLRYLSNAYTWDGLLSKIAYELVGNREFYFDIKAKCQDERGYHYEKIGSLLEEEFNSRVAADRNGKFKDVNDLFYAGMEHGINISRFKLYIAQLLNDPKIKEDRLLEIAELKKARKNIGSIITTNYDGFIERVFEFSPLVGNDILLSNPYGSVYKIHGCCSDPFKIIINEQDYRTFDTRYELIRAQLLSLFIHNPIIFIGYNIGDENIRKILKTIYSYIDYGSETAEKIRRNFLLVEYDAGSNSVDIHDHDIVVSEGHTIRINKIKTDNFQAVYQALASLNLPISAMDVRKVQTVVKEIYAGGNINVRVTEDLDSLDNGDMILAIGSKKTITYVYHTAAEVMSNYFKIIEESNAQLISLIDKFRISSGQYFPVFAFSEICTGLICKDDLRKQQVDKLNEAMSKFNASCRNSHATCEEIENDSGIAITYRANAIVWAIMHDSLNLDDAEKYLKAYEDKQSTNYKKMLCAYDYKRYGALESLTSSTETRSESPVAL